MRQVLAASAGAASLANVWRAIAAADKMALILDLCSDDESIRVSLRASVSLQICGRVITSGCKTLESGLNDC